MPVKHDRSGRRSVDVEVEVPGTPEEVWQAIATGPGISSWFVPSEVEEREGGRAISHFGPGDSMDSVATVTAWQPPHRFVAESRDLRPDAPPVATEWVVEARSGGTCVVRVVHSLFASGEDWDDQLQALESGWPAFFRILKMYLTHFPGRRCSTVQLMGVAPEPVSTAWDALTGALGLAGATVGRRVIAPAGAPPLAGLVERSGDGNHAADLLLRLDEPAPGIAHLFALPMGGQVYVPIHLFLYGDRAPDAVAHQQPLWQAWMNEHFPPADDGSNADANKAD